MPQRETSKHQEAFEEWYAAGRNFRKISENFGIKSSTLYGWADDFNWHERADARDTEARRRADSDAVRQAARRLEAQQRVGTALRQLATGHFFRTNKDGEVIPYEFESTSAALNTLKEGVQLERQADGLPDVMVMALNANENQIQSKRDEVFAELERRRSERGRDASLLDGDGPSGGEDDA